MKKTKLIALTMVIAIMMIGAGYAAWTDQLDINTTINTGKLDLQFDRSLQDFEFEPNNDYMTGKVSYAKDNDGEWDIANVTLSNLYPDAKAKVTLKIDNKSTIPVKMLRITDERSWKDSDECFKQISATVRFFDSEGKVIKFIDSGNQSPSGTYANPWQPKEFGETEIPVGGYATLSFGFVPLDGIESEEYTFTPKVEFKQFNK